MGGKYVGANVRSEDGEDGVVVLEKCAGWVGELEGVDVFGCEGVRSCDAGFCGGVGEFEFFF